MKAERADIMRAIGDAVYLAPTEFREETRIRDLALDSMDYVEIMMVLNTRFQVPVDSSTMAEIETVGDLVNYAVAHQGHAAGTASLEKF